MNHRNTIRRISSEFRQSAADWILAFSGGKDSTALLNLTLTAVATTKKSNKQLYIVYCDTGIEIPYVRSHTMASIANLKKEVCLEKIPVKVVILKPKLHDRFFVKVMGKGYPPPTNKFRWCTDRLRINPLQAFIAKNRLSDSIILLGTRKGESIERDRILTKHIGNHKGYYNQVGFSRSKIFAPLIDYSENDVWDSLIKYNQWNNIDLKNLLKLYKAAGQFSATNIQKGARSRFGCWMCTVIRKDRAMISMINNGYSELSGLLKYRDWIVSIRDNLDFRCKRRRNSNRGLGPIKLEGRLQMLKELERIESQCPWQLISNPEKRFIRELWLQDLNDPEYCSLE